MELIESKAFMAILQKNLTMLAMPYGRLKLKNLIVSYRSILIHVLIGAIAGVILLHPLTMAIYWFEFHPIEYINSTFWEFMISRMAKSFTGGMFTMMGIFVLLGGGLGLAFGMYHRAMTKHSHLVSFLVDELAKDLQFFIEKSESEFVEFKASARWDHQQSKLNKALEEAIIKTIAGFMNHHGGTLLIGVDDSGTVIGLEYDYATLKKTDRDGFQQYIMGLISVRLGTDLCPLVHVIFHKFEEKDVCRLLIETSPRPVYVNDRATQRYFLRTGNSTRELDVREALAHVKQRWPEQ